MNTMQNRARGCLLGQLIGDSLGSQVEFKTSFTIKNRYPNGVREIKDGGSWNTLAGQPTDDSEMALALARSLISCDGYNEQAVKQSYVDWLYSEPFDCGGTISGSLQGYYNPNSQANGALMRISPLGIWGAKKDIDLLRNYARTDAKLTHINQLCQDINAVYVSLIAEAIRTGISGKDLFDKLFADPSAYAGTQNFHRKLKTIIQDAAEKKPILDAENKGWVALAFQNALYYLAHADNFEEALVETVSAGGDTDTNGAICGALLGAVFGERNIPERWKNTVLQCRADRAHHAKHPRPECYWAVDAPELADTLLG